MAMIIGYHRKSLVLIKHNWIHLLAITYFLKEAKTPYLISSLWLWQVHGHFAGAWGFLSKKIISACSQRTSFFTLILNPFEILTVDHLLCEFKSITRFTWFYLQKTICKTIYKNLMSSFQMLIKLLSSNVYYSNIIK
jgi:hypothetical protein